MKHSHKKNVFLYEDFELVRKNLLDLSRRNRLLNYKHPKSKCIRIIDELPNQIIEIMNARKSFTFIPVPEPKEKELIEAGYINSDQMHQKKRTSSYPTAKQWANRLGLDTSFNLPINDKLLNAESKHQDNKLQTLLYQQDLEARLRHIYNSSKLVIEESGSNILYLTLGFLEWYEDTNSDIQRLAPLFSIPVELYKIKNRMSYQRQANSSLNTYSSSLDSPTVYYYKVCMKGDDLLTNITLQEKLANDFGLCLPTIEENMMPEHYFDLVRKKILSQKPRWKIKRQASLVLLNFLQQAIYEDLNPNNWSEERNIKDHPIIRKFFSSGSQSEGSDSLSYVEEYPIDNMIDVHNKYPIIYDADSSQHSALIDAVKGDNIVIEGPPGSGKSQTITNLIAACINSGKKVLFIAEKMTALDVVKQKLDKANLGDFCLELHSYRTDKKRILKDIESRLNKKFKSLLDINNDISIYEEYKRKLNDYVNLINSKWRNTGLSIHEILTKATRYREHTSINPEKLIIHDLNGKSLTKIKRTELLDQADNLSLIYNRISSQTSSGDISDHYWYGVNKIDLSGPHIETFIQYLHSWNNSLRELSEYWDVMSDKLDFNIQNDTELESIFNTGNLLMKLPEITGRELFDQLSIIVENIDSYSKILQDYTIIHKELADLGKVFHEGTLNSLGMGLKMRDSLKMLQGLYNQEARLSLEDVQMCCDSIKKVKVKISSIEEQFKKMISSLSGGIKDVFNVSLDGLNEFTILIRLIRQLPFNLWKERDPIYQDPDLDEWINTSFSAREL